MKRSQQGAGGEKPQQVCRAQQAQQAQRPKMPTERSGRPGVRADNRHTQIDKARRANKQHSGGPSLAGSARAWPRSSTPSRRQVAKAPPRMPCTNTMSISGASARGFLMGEVLNTTVPCLCFKTWFVLAAAASETKVRFGAGAGAGRLRAKTSLGQSKTPQLLQGSWPSGGFASSLSQ